MCVCQFLYVYAYACVRVRRLPNVESRKRKRLDGWRGCLFIHYPAASVVSGGHGNTCPGPFSAGLVCGLLWPCQSLQLSPPLLSALLHCHSFLFFFIPLNLHWCFSYSFSVFSPFGSFLLSFCSCENFLIPCKNTTCQFFHFSFCADLSRYSLFVLQIFVWQDKIYLRVAL